MKIVRFQVWLLASCGAALVCCAAPARAQTEVERMCGDGSYHPAGFNCTAYLCSNGWAQSHGLGYRCGSSGGAPSGPSAAEIEAERERAAERKRLADLADADRKQQQLDAERRQREHDEWMRSLNDAVGSLKGVSTDDMGLKGVGGQTDFFGLKGVSPDEASSMIKTGEPEGSPHSVTGAWQQLHCAAELAGDAIADLSKIETGAADARELDEIKFVAGQASAVMNGGTVTVECAPAPPMNVHLTSSDIERQTPIMDGLLKRAVHDAQTYVESTQRADGLRQQLDTLKAQRAAPAAQQPISSPAAAPAPTPQTSPGFSQSADQQKINTAIQQQKAYQKSHEDYYALLRETQRALNDANSQKISSQADADKVQKETQAILAGQFTATSTSTQSQAQKKYPGDDQ